MTQQTQEVDVVVTSKGRRIQPPARYRQIAVPQGPAKPDGEGCKIARKITWERARDSTRAKGRERGQSREERD